MRIHSSLCVIKILAERHYKKKHLRREQINEIWKQKKPNVLEENINEIWNCSSTFHTEWKLLNF